MIGILKYKNVFISEACSIVGKSESEGPLSAFFDIRETDQYFGQDTWEKAESEMARQTIAVLLSKSNKKSSDIDICAGGDLLNQCTSSSFAVAEFGIPFLGLYGACSTAAESLMVSSALISAGYCNSAVAFASSHFCAAEKQYRFPLEYGGQRTPTSQNTVTGSGAFLVSNSEGDICVSEGFVGKIVDGGIKDANNMGAAMAPAAVDTIERYFNSSDYTPDDFDIIATGDLGREGYEIACELLKRSNINIKDKFTDCGMLIYDIEKDDMHSGGSGCGCSAAVTAGYFFKRMKKNELKRILLIGTGALLSRISAFQGRTIPSVAHAVVIERK